jgi:hypothetical protein
MSEPEPGSSFQSFAVCIALAASLGLAACVVSIEPIVPEADAIFDPELLGAWLEVDGDDRVEVTRADESLYEIVYASDLAERRYHARLGELGARRILDVWPAVEEDPVLAREPLLVGGHLLVELGAVGPDVVVTRVMEPESLRAALVAGDLPLEYTDAESLVLRGSTTELRAALRPFLDWPSAFAAPTEWRRVAPEATPNEPVTVPCFEAAAWREADQLFRGDPHWRGADVASSVDLGGGRTLWLFGDTWIDPSGHGTRQGAHMVSNSLGMQEGSDPSTARMSFHWGRAADGSPVAFFPDRDGESLWFGSGVRVEDRLVLFLGRTVRNTGAGLGFDHVGWTAMLVENPNDEPPAWRIRALTTPSNPFGVLVGFAASFRMGDQVYALGSPNPLKTHPIYAVRWAVDRVRQGDLADPEWWAGDRAGWVADTSSVPRWPLFDQAQTELTVHPDPATDRFLAVHTQGFGSADIVMRAAPTLTGPWSAPRMIYRPPEYHRPQVMIYAGKAHPHLAGADLALTYATNSFRFADHADPSIYFPRFVRLSRCGDPTGGAGGAGPAATAPGRAVRVPGGAPWLRNERVLSPLFLLLLYPLVLGLTGYFVTRWLT